MNKKELLNYLERLDRSLHSPASLYIYGSAACILLDEPDRTSLDIDVAGPYSNVDQNDLRQAAESIGLPVNPEDAYEGNHIEWVGPLRLCLQPPVPGSGMTLWQGSKLRIHTGSVADLIASKLIRYDELDRADIQYLLKQNPIPFNAIASSAERLPPRFSRDALVRENLENLNSDMKLWGHDLP